jgi:serine/threonine protein kinase
MAYPSRTDIVTAMRNPQVSFKANELIGGSVIRIGSRIIQYAGGYTTVFPFYTRESKKVAVRCWIADIGDAKKRCQEISIYLNTLNNPYFCNFKYLDDAILISGSIYPVVIMDWANGKPLKEYINDNRYSFKTILPKIASNFKQMVKYFHEENIAHGDLQHGNILVTEDCSLIIIDYDSMFVKPLEGMSDAIKGLPGYQHPSRNKNKFINHKLDYFSELVIYLSLLAFEQYSNLWDKYYETEDLLFSKDDFHDPTNSQIINTLLLSENQNIKELTQQLIEQLKKSDIMDLQPLEELLIDKLKVAKDKITTKWDNQPNKPEKRKVKVQNIKNITDKF